MRFASLGLGLAFGLMTAGTVFAADLVVEPVAVVPVAESDWQPYVKLYGGGTIPNVLEWDGADYDVDAGWLLGGSLGLQINENIAVELDGTYSASQYSASTEELNGATLMANVVISGPLSDQITVYGGLGLGAVGAQYLGGDWGYASGGQVFAGVSFSVADNISIFGEARYQSAFELVSTDGGAHDIEMQRTSVLAGVKFGF